uniref:Putative secreted protein n=1 Tax=Panstrongylus lignarius TaxID=156445 RepID=A0A224XUS1_9HEMI
MQWLLLLLWYNLLWPRCRRAMYYMCCHIRCFTFHQLFQHESIGLVYKRFVKSIAGIVFAIKMGSPMRN